MLLTITYFGKNPTDLGFLLHKNPYRPQEFQLNSGKAYVFYPEINDNFCTSALLLDINPVDLARGKAGSKTRGLFDYVNDRPYVSSSFMSTAISQVFGTAMSGRCKQLPELANTPIDLSATLTSLPCKGDYNMINKIFEPLGYSVEYENEILDEKFPNWGESYYINLTIKGKVLLKDLLSHLYLLIPIFDKQKHYWIGKDEIEKLLNHGKGWLENHPHKNYIISRYFNRKKSYMQTAIKLLDENPIEETDDASTKEQTPRLPNLNTQRLQAVIDTLKQHNITSVIDMGCGEGKLLNLMLKDSFFTKIAGFDVSFSILEQAHRKLKLDKIHELTRKKITLFQSSLTYKDQRFNGYDAATVVEVIEHMDENRLWAFREILFGETAPKLVVITTPNIEYNEIYESLSKDKLRHGDHRFEWTRNEFQEWCNEICDQFGYKVKFSDIGDNDIQKGSPTQMGVFIKCE